MSNNAVTYSYVAFDGYHRIARNDLTAATLRTQVGNLAACMYRVIITSSEGTVFTSSELGDHL